MEGRDRPPVLVADRVTVGYGSDRNSAPVLHRVSISLEHGQTIGLVGESGSGKSTLAKTVVGLLRPREGRVLINGVDPAHAPGGVARSVQRKVQLIPQDPYSSLDPRRTIGQTITEAINPKVRVARQTDRRRAAELLNMVALRPEDADRYPHEFSGGQRQRVAIARALAVKPDVIVADEITSSLDNSVQAEILNLLRGIQRRTSTSLLFISHNLAVVRYMSDEIAVMYLGSIVEQGSTAVFDEPHHPYTNVLLQSIPDIEMNTFTAPPESETDGAGDPAHPPPGCAFHPRCPVGPAFIVGREVCINRVPTLLPAEGADEGSLCSCHFPIKRDSGLEDHPARRRPFVQEAERDE